MANELPWPGEQTSEYSKEVPADFVTSLMKLFFNFAHATLLKSQITNVMIVPNTVSKKTHTWFMTRFLALIQVTHPEPQAMRYTSSIKGPTRRHQFNTSSTESWMKMMITE